MKSLIMLWSEVAKELGHQCDVSTTRDLETVTSRVEDEGVSFLTITLPTFCKSLERGLADGRTAPSDFPSFRCGSTCLPLFLGGFTELIFNRDSGSLLDEPSVAAIHAVRQLTLMFGKVEMRASERRVRAAFDAFVETEESVRSYDASRTPIQEVEFERMCSMLWGSVLNVVEGFFYREHRGYSGTSDPEWPYVIPKHGPGATADRATGNRKYDFREWTTRLESTFPFGEYGIPSWRYHNLYDRVTFLDPGDERPVRVVDVPKTLKTPRIIAIEPSYMQYMQQAVKSLVVDAIRDDNVLGRVVGFDDQWRNNAAACRGSLDGSLATLDLSEASDRVSNQLVDIMLRRYTLTREAVSATRSLRADVPGHGILPLAKFASMGSALTFPIEAMIFTIIVFLGIEKSLGRQMTKADIFQLRSRVRVYGDDIIVPVDSTSSVIETLEAFGLRVNSHKSFWTGLFRESCGREYYAGHDVSVVRVRKVAVNIDDGIPEFPASRTHVREVESLINLRNRFYLSGLWSTARYLDGVIEPILSGHYPTIQVTPGTHENEFVVRSNVLSRWTFLPYPSFEDWKIDQRTQSPVVRGWVVKARIPSSRASGFGSLLKVLLPVRFTTDEEESNPYTGDFTILSDKDHLVQAGRPQSASMKLRNVRI